MARKLLKTKLRFTFNIEDDLPIVDIKVPLKKKESKKKEIQIIKLKRNGRESNTKNPRLF